MIMTVAYLHGKVKFSALLKNWLIVFVANFVGCVIGASCFAYASGLFSDESTKSYIHALVMKKANLDPGQAFMR